MRDGDGRRCGRGKVFSLIIVGLAGENSNVFFLYLWKESIKAMKDYLELSELLARVRESVADAFPERCWV